jgi:tetratricopeptide (TPR) repeat protein
VRRNRVAVGAGALVLAALLYGLVSARRSELVAEAEAQHAKTEADSFQSIASFLMDGFLPAQPAQDAAWQERARVRVLGQAERVRRQHADSDHLRANLLDTLGQVCLRLDLFEEGERLMREALEIREQAFGLRSLEYALSLRSLGQLKFKLGDFAEAARLLEQALPLHRAAAPSTHADVSALANDLAACWRNLGREVEAETLHREALALRREQGAGTLPVAESLNNLAAVHLGRSQTELAVTELREALSIRSAILGDGHLLTLQTTSNLAGALWRLGEPAEARERMQRAEAGYRMLGGDGEDGLGLVLANLATMQLAGRDLDGAATSLEEALELQTKRLGDDHPSVAATLAKLATLHHARRDDDEARRIWDETLRIRRAVQASPRELAEALCGYGVFLSDIGEPQSAARLVEEAIGLHRSQDLGDAPGLGRAQYLLGVCLSRLGRREEAREHLIEAARLFDFSPGATPDERSRVRKSLEALDQEAGR